MTVAVGVEDPTSSVPVVVARQPITDRQGAIVAFELLYRPGHPPANNGEDMTAQVLLGALSIGVDRLVGPRWIFCNAERGVLVGEPPVALPPERTVVEVLETVETNDEIVDGCRRLCEAGFTLALDDFVWRDGVERLLELARVVKGDFLAVPRDELRPLVARCREYDVHLLAEKIETAEDLALAQELGFDLSRDTRSNARRWCTGRPSRPRRPLTCSSRSRCWPRTSTSRRSRRSCAGSRGWWCSFCTSPRSAAGVACAGTSARSARRMVLLGPARIRQRVA